jgi:hypothetical protein
VDVDVEEPQWIVQLELNGFTRESRLDAGMREPPNRYVGR